MSLLSTVSCCSNSMFALSTKGTTGSERESQKPASSQRKQFNFVRNLAPPLMAVIVAFSPICNDPGSFGKSDWKKLPAPNACSSKASITRWPDDVLMTSSIILAISTMELTDMGYQSFVQSFGSLFSKELRLSEHLKGFKSPYLIFFYAAVAFGQTIDMQRGGSLFNRACIGCHDAGGNIIQPNATLFSKDLQRNGVDTEEEIYRVTYFGKGRMPGFGENCTPRGQCTFGARLLDDEIKILAQFVKAQADQGWPKIEIAEE